MRRLRKLSNKIHGDVVPSKRDVLEAGLSLNCKVCDMVENGDWKWPDIWRSKLPFLFHLPPPLIIHGKNDMVLWKYNDGKVGNFLVKAVWSDLSVSKPSVPWYKLVWLSQNILRHAFILWLAINQKLKTLNRIAIWQGIPDVKCSLCFLNVVTH
ncbi:RNA-directed DNA polymerase, eukaryota, reverse transcriptase zinc-binding domain protein [Tanacetum coccineum]